jgi:competence protein ComEC
MALWFVFILFLINFHHLDLRTKVTVFDVNQGDSIYIQSPQCKLLIDTGISDDYDTLIHYFKSKNIGSIDALILTHQHADHTGEAKDLIRVLKIQQIYTNRINDEIPVEKQSVVGQGQTINCGNLFFEILNGNRDDKNENNNSLVLYTVINHETWLLAADIEAVVEIDLVQRYHFQVDHLKVAHHGSNTSSTKAFIDHFKPKHVYISVGRNYYGMPDQDVLNRFSQANSIVYSTQDLGTIEVVYLGPISYKSNYKNGYKDYLFFE